MRVLQLLWHVKSGLLLRYALVAGVSVFAIGCSAPSPGYSADAESYPNTSQAAYHANSWRSLIPDDCQAFFDGCNRCARATDSEVAACTRMACAQYEKPRCLDKSMELSQGHRKKYLCGNRQIEVVYREYIADDQRIQLRDGQIMLRDAESHVATVLMRQPSASGEKYSNSAMSWWGKGEQALLQREKNDTPVECSLIK